MKQKIAIISDIHGNSFALEAVLKDISHRNVDLIFNLGDSI
ncbi:YfcE family phosphodiesterase, partial [Bacillus cereus]